MTPGTAQCMLRIARQPTPLLTAGPSPLATQNPGSPPSQPPLPATCHKAAHSAPSQRLRLQASRGAGALPPAPAAPRVAAERRLGASPRPAAAPVPGRAAHWGAAVEAGEPQPPRSHPVQVGRGGRRVPVAPQIPEAQVVCQQQDEAGERAGRPAQRRRQQQQQGPQRDPAPRPHGAAAASRGLCRAGAQLSRAASHVTPPRRRACRGGGGGGGLAALPPGLRHPARGGAERARPRPGAALRLRPGRREAAGGGGGGEHLGGRQRAGTGLYVPWPAGPASAPRCVLPGRCCL